MRIEIIPNHHCGNGEVKPAPMSGEKVRKRQDRQDKIAWKNSSDIIITVRESDVSDFEPTKNAKKLLKKIKLGLKIVNEMERRERVARKLIAEEVSKGCKGYP